MYGTSSYQGFPYRHPFVTLHQVIHEGTKARLAEGQLMTIEMLGELLSSLGRLLPTEFLPERVLVRTEEMIVWWLPPNRRTMFFSDRGGDELLKKMTGKRYPHPSLLFKACGSHLSVRALERAERPKPDTRMCMAPYWNCYDNGVVCTGTMKIPQEKSVAAIQAWESSFFSSEFTHASGIRRHTRFPGGLIAMWQALEGAHTFPGKYLVRLPQTLSDFVNDHDHSYRNQHGPAD